MSWTTVDCERQNWNLAGDPAEKPLPSPWTCWNTISRSASGNGSVFSSTALTTEKIAVLAPIPRASAATAASVNPGLRRNRRSECRVSLARAANENTGVLRQQGGRWDRPGMNQRTRAYPGQQTTTVGGSFTPTSGPRTRPDLGRLDAEDDEAAAFGHGPPAAALSAGEPRRPSVRVQLGACEDQIITRRGILQRRGARILADVEYARRIGKRLQFERHVETGPQEHAAVRTRGAAALLVGKQRRENGPVSVQVGVQAGGGAADLPDLLAPGIDTQRRIVGREPRRRRPRDPGEDGD